ncbi:MAG: glycosyl hydrolase family 18 protein, partial [Defluviitaleaceae bacterium]|nr:glycosyl hydrolase family 18 protein [Defluviitaleaceae bacterium]
VTIDDAGTASTHAVITSAGRLRSRPDNHATYIEEVHAGDRVLLLREAAEEDFWQVRSANAIVGYVQTNLVGETTVTAAVMPTPEQPLNRKQPMRYPIVMLWDQWHTNRDLWNVSPHATIMSPAWFQFRFEDGQADGTIIDSGNREYVAFAHANNRMVWPKLTDNFNSIVSHAVLSCTDTRKFVVDQVLELIVYYNLDGINVDYEAVLVADAAYFLQFLRELRPPMHELGAYLSVALFVPRYTMYMNRTEIAKVVDYVAVMAYDEHWSGAGGAGTGPGPVASLPFVEEGIVRTMDEVPTEMIIIGVPFYNRIWREVTEPDGSTHNTIRNISMNYARRMFTENGATFTWLDDIGSYYAQYPDPVYPNVMHRVWLECARSIERKLQLATSYNLPGIAAWHSGLENDETWNVIAQYIENKRR